MQCSNMCRLSSAHQGGCINQDCSAESKPCQGCARCVCCLNVLIDSFYLRPGTNCWAYAKPSAREDGEEGSGLEDSNRH